MKSLENCRILRSLMTGAYKRWPSVDKIPDVLKLWLLEEKVERSICSENTEIGSNVGRYYLLRKIFLKILLTGMIGHNPPLACHFAPKQSEMATQVAFFTG